MGEAGVIFETRAHRSALCTRQPVTCFLTLKAYSGQQVRPAPFEDSPL
jgi:hypothetical protein